MSTIFTIPSDLFFSELNEEEDLSACVGTETVNFKSINNNPVSLEKPKEMQMSGIHFLAETDNNLPQQTKKESFCSSKSGRKKKLPLRFKEAFSTIIIPNGKKTSVNKRTVKMPLRSNKNKSSLKQKLLKSSLIKEEWQRTDIKCNTKKVVSCKKGLLKTTLNKKEKTNRNGSSPKNRLLKKHSGAEKRKTKAIKNGLNKSIERRQVLKNKKGRSIKVELKNTTGKQTARQNVHSPGKYECNRPNCGKVYQYLRGLRLHQRSACGDSKFKSIFACPYCPQKKNLKSSLRTHVHNFHREKFVEWYKKNYSNLKFLQCHLNSKVSR